MRQITIRIAGTACFVADDDSSFERRLVLPLDKIGNVARTQDELHLPYVEFPAANITSGTNLSAKYQHPMITGQIDYRRFSLAGHVITVENLKVDETFTVLQSFIDHVPAMRVVEPNLDSRPRSEVFLDSPDPTLMAAFFDISTGTLKGGNLYEFITDFVRPTSEVTASVRTCEYVELIATITTPELVVTFTKPDAPTVRIVLDEKADLITIGDQTEADISGTGSNDDITHHFKLYYNLADPVNYPTDPPVPLKRLDPFNACTVTTWP